MKQNEIDTVVIVDGKLMWKKDWEKLKHQQENEINDSFYFAVVYKTFESFYNTGSDEHNIAIIKSNVDPVDLPDNYPYFEYSQIVNEYDFVGGKSSFHGHNTIDYYGHKDDSSWDKECVVPDISSSNFVSIDIKKTLNNINKKYPLLDLKLIEIIPYNKFQSSKCSKQRNAWLKQYHPNNWFDFLEEDIEKYLDELNEKTDRTIKIKNPKEYKLVEIR